MVSPTRELVDPMGLRAGELSEPGGRQVDGESSDISCVLSPYLLTIYYRGEPVGSWRATREGARWHDRHKEEDATRVVLRDVYDAIEHTKRALFLFVRDVKNR